MKLNLNNGVARYFTLLLSLLLLALVTACGGGNGSAGAPIGGTGSGSGSGGVATTHGAVTVTLANSTGASNTIAAGGSLVATAHVVDAAGAAVANAVVTFSVSSTVGSLPITSALTNSSGNAIVNLQQGSTTGAATLTATTTVVGTTAVTGTINFQSGATSATSSPTIALALANVTGCAAITVNTSCPLTANATVTDATGAPIVNSIVTFANTLSYAVLSPSSGTVLTNQSGVASVTVSAAGLAPTGANGNAGTINVSTTVGGVTVVGKQNFVYGNTPVSLSVVQPASPAAVNAYGTKIIQIEVDANGVIYTAQPVTVSFSSNCASLSPALATLPASATTVNGIATVTYTDKGCAQTDTVTASVSGAQAVSVALNVATPSVASINFISAVPSDKSIVLLGAGGTGRTSTATLTFQVVNFSGQPVSNASVTFTNNQTSIATLNASSGTTDANGMISVTVTAGSTTPGTFAITATTPTTGAATVSAISSGIVVSTGVPIQASFTVAPLVLNIEGFSVAGTTTTVTTYIADASGHAVVDGTPVEASTNEGSIGASTSASGGCTTLVGKCGLTFTSQNPRCLVNASNQCIAGTIGVATISATSTNNTTIPLSGTTYIYMSDGHPTFYSAITGTTVDVTGGANLQAANCSPNIFLVVADINGNPLPFQTAFAVTTTTTAGLALGAIFPSSNSNIGYGGGFSFASANNGIVNGQGITIPYTLTSPGLPVCSASGTHTASFNFSVNTTSPLGIATQTPFVYTYPTP